MKIRYGFTLIELLVVIAIIAILMGIQPRPVRAMTGSSCRSKRTAPTTFNTCAADIIPPAKKAVEIYCCIMYDTA